VPEGRVIQLQTKGYAQILDLCLYCIGSNFM